MQNKKYLVVLTVLLMAAVLMGGCAKDPRIMVTPFVLKAELPPETQGNSVPDMTACTKPYEDAVTD